MKSIFTVARITITEFSTYRVNFFLWRFRMIVRSLITYFIWKAIFTSQSQVGGYSSQEMFTYLLMGYVVVALIFSGRSQDLGDEINSGRLSNAMIRPQNYLHFMMGRELGDKIVNVLCAIVEILILGIVLRPPFSFPTQLSTWGIFGLAVMGGTILYFLINTLLSMLGFWTNEVWAGRFIFFIFLDFLVGWIIPPDLFPSPLKEIVFLTPFPYMFFFPTKIFLETLSRELMCTGFIGLSAWCVILGMLCVLVWKKGLRHYSADGR